MAFVNPVTTVIVGAVDSHHLPGLYLGHKSCHLTSDQFGGVRNRWPARRRKAEELVHQPTFDTNNNLHEADRATSSSNRLFEKQWSISSNSLTVVQPKDADPVLFTIEWVASGQCKPVRFTQGFSAKPRKTEKRLIH